MNLKKMKKWQIIAIVAVVIVGGYFWYKKTHPVAVQLQYTTSPAEKGTLTTSVSGSGNVIVDQSVNIDPTISGTVSNLAVNIGDKVIKGQILFTIINDDLTVSDAKSTASLQQSKNSLESAQVQVDQTKADYDAAKKSDTSTHDQKEILKEKIEIAKQGVIASQKSYNATLADYNNQFKTSAKRTVTAPIDGTVNSINVKNGDDLSKLSSGSSRTVPIIIGDLNTMKAQVQINEVDVPNIQIGQKSMMTFTAVDGLSVSGKVEKMDSLGTVTQSVVTYNATIGFDTLDPRIKPGMSVTASIITGVKQDVITVPNSAVKSKGNNNYVEILNSGQVIPEQVTVQVGLANNTETEITSGLKVGDNVVTKTTNPGAAATTTATSSSNRQGGGLRVPGL